MWGEALSGAERLGLSLRRFLSRRRASSNGSLVFDSLWGARSGLGSFLRTSLRAPACNVLPRHSPGASLWGLSRCPRGLDGRLMHPALLGRSAAAELGFTSCPGI